MPHDTLVTLVGFRRTAERRALSGLATQMSRVEQAREALGVPPRVMEPSGEALFATLDERRLDSGMAWAVWGERLERLERAVADEDRSRAEWAAAAADLRATQRLVARRHRQRRAEAAKRARTRMDEAAVTAWRRDHAAGAVR